MKNKKTRKVLIIKYKYKEQVHNNGFNLTFAVVTESAGRYRSPALSAPSLHLRFRPQLQVKPMLD